VRRVLVGGVGVGRRWSVRLLGRWPVLLLGRVPIWLLRRLDVAVVRRLGIAVVRRLCIAVIGRLCVAVVWRLCVAVVVLDVTVTLHVIEQRPNRRGCDGGVCAVVDIHGLVHVLLRLVLAIDGVNGRRLGLGRRLRLHLHGHVHGGAIVVFVYARLEPVGCLGMSE
jgi:hypothetical protein